MSEREVLEQISVPKSLLVFEEALDQLGSFVQIAGMPMLTKVFDAVNDAVGEFINDYALVRAQQTLLVQGFEALLDIEFEPHVNTGQLLVNAGEVAMKFHRLGELIERIKVQKDFGEWAADISDEPEVLERAFKAFAAVLDGEDE